MNEFYNYKFSYIWTYLAFGSFIPLFFGFFATIPLFVMFAYLSYNEEQNVQVLKMLVKDCYAFEQIDIVLNNSNPDMGDLKYLTTKANIGNGFKEYAYKVNLPNSIINKIQSELIEPYLESYHKAISLIEESSK